MTVRNVKKNLAALQDMLLGVNVRNQTRRGITVAVEGIAKSFVRLWKEFIGANYKGTFEDGCTVTATGDVVLSIAKGEAYKWVGTVPGGGIVIPIDSTIESTGGISGSTWQLVPNSTILDSFNAIVGVNGANGIYYTPDAVASLPQISVGEALRKRRQITDLGAVTGVASATVDARVIAAVDAGYAIVLPSNFNYVPAGTLTMPSLKPVVFDCPDGRAKVTASVASLMFESPNTFKFNDSYFRNIDFVGADKQNTASQWMQAPEGKYLADFITEDCTWIGFHTVCKASCIAVKHYRPKYYGCGDTGAIADSYHWTGSLFSSFNLCEWHEPKFIGKFGRLFKILGGYNNYIIHPWFEKVEIVSAEMILLRQHFNVQIQGGWLENFKAQFLFNLDGDGTENTQSDICIIDGLHINNNWSLDPAHSGAASGFTALFNRIAPANSGNQYDTKFVFKNIMEHPDSVAGWALTRTGSTLNLATSIHEFIGCRLKVGQPNSSDGMTLAGGSPDLRRHMRDLSSNKLDLIPGNYQTITGRNTTGSQKDLIFDNVGDTTYFRRNSVKLLEWTTNYFAPGTANALQCGVASRPWSGGYTQVAFTVTSDENAKLNITDILEGDSAVSREELDKIIAAWRKVNFFIYQLKEGPDTDSWHFGIVAQRAIAAFTAEGLDWKKYALFNHDKWEHQDAVYDDAGVLIAEEVEAGEMYTVNYDEVLILDAAAAKADLIKQKELNEDILARLAKLEAK